MNIGGLLERISPTALAITASVGTCATAVLAAAAAPDAMKRKEEAQKQKGKEELTLWEMVKAEMPVYIPAIAMGASSIACIFFINGVSRHRQASIAGAYMAVSELHAKYRDKVKKIFGAEGDRTVLAAIRQDEEADDDDRPPWDQLQTFYFEPYGKFFEATMADVVYAQYHLNRLFHKRGGVTVNEFLDMLGLEPVQKGNELGWNVWDGEAFYGYDWVEFNNVYRMNDDGMQICAIETPFRPHYAETEFSHF